MFSSWSGRLDLNQRPLEPHSSALPDCATPRQESTRLAPRAGPVNTEVLTFVIEEHRSSAPAYCSLNMSSREGSGVSRHAGIQRSAEPLARKAASLIN